MLHWMPGANAPHYSHFRYPTLPPILLLLLLLSPSVFLARLQEQSNLQAAEFVLLPRGIIRFNALLLLLHMQWWCERGGRGGVAWLCGCLVACGSTFIIETPTNQTKNPNRVAPNPACHPFRPRAH